MPEDMVKKYRRRFLQEGFICKAVDSGFYALTMLEREKPSLIIATEDIEDLEIHDLLEIIDSDSDLSDTRIIVLSKNMDKQSNERCMTLSIDSTFEAILATAYQLIGIHTEEALEAMPIDTADSVNLFNEQIEEKLTNNIIVDDEPSEDSSDNTGDSSSKITIGRAGAALKSTSPENTNPESATLTANVEKQNQSISLGNHATSGSTPADVRYDTSDAQITGEVASDQLVELINTFAMGSRGLLIVRTAKADGRLLLEQSRLLKAEYDGSQGQEAFNGLLYNAMNAERVSYFFKRYDNASSSKGSTGKGVALSYLLKVSGDLIKS